MESGQCVHQGTQSVATDAIPYQHCHAWPYGRQQQQQQRRRLRHSLLCHAERASSVCQQVTEVHTVVAAAYQVKSGLLPKHLRLYLNNQLRHKPRRARGKLLIRWLARVGAPSCVWIAKPKAVIHATHLQLGSRSRV
jgi:hypothetical protein